jgi:carbonic anhydrase
MTKNQKNTLTSIIESNEDYSESFNQGNLSAKPSKSIAILTCMDTRINIEKVCGLESGEAHIIRNAGGKVTDDTMRSFVVSYKLLGTKDWFVIQHTDCGLSKITDEKMASLLESNLETASFENGDWNSNKNDNSESGSSFGHQVEWNTFLDLKKSILEDIEKIKNHPLTPSYINIYGLIYDVKTGELETLEN